MAALYGIVAAITYGAADFLGGLGARALPATTVALWSQVFGTAFAAALVGLFRAPVPGPTSFAWAAGAGAAGGMGVMLLYRGLARGQMSVIAPVTAVIAAIVPVLVGFALGERPTAAALAGMAIALVAITLVSLAPDGRSGSLPTGSLLLLALGAGVGFGVFFVMLERSGTGSGLWPLLGARAGSLTVLSLLLTAERGPRVPARANLALVAGAGVLDVGANLFFLLGTRAGLLSLVAVLTSLYPAATVVLARAVLKERLARPQLAGLVLALAGIVLIVGS